MHLQVSVQSAWVLVFVFALLANQQLEARVRMPVGFSLPEECALADPVDLQTRI